MDEQAKRCRAEYYRQYREKNRDKLNAYRRAWAKENRDKVRQYRKNYWTRKAEARKGGQEDGTGN